MDEGLSANRLPKPTLWSAWGALSAGGAPCGPLNDGFLDWESTNTRLPPTETTSYGLLLIVNIDPDSRTEPAVLVSVEDA